MLAPRPLTSPLRLSHFFPGSHRPIPRVSVSRFRSTATSTFRARPSRFGTCRCSFGNDGRGGGDDEGPGGGFGFGDCGSLLSWYMKVLAMYPLLTNSVTSAFLNLAGDIFCQLFINRVSVLDFRRLSAVAFLGLALVGPTLQFWFRYLIQVVTLKGYLGTILRLFIDQFLFSPVFIGAYIFLVVVLEGRLSGVVPTLQQQWFPSIVANWQLWIPFQFLNFQFVPQKLQVLASNFVALAWNVILSFKTHTEVIAK